MPATNFTAIDAILQKDIKPAVKSQMYEKALLWRLFRGFQQTGDGEGYMENQVMPIGAMNTNMVNNKLYFPIVTGRTGGATAVSANNEVIYGTAPMLQGVVNLVTNTGAFLITEQVLEANGVVRDTFAFEMEQTANSMAADANRQAYSDGSAVLAKVAGSSSGTTLNLVASVNDDIDYADYLPLGTQIKIGANAPTAVVAVLGKNSVQVSASQTYVTNSDVVKLDGSNATAVEFAGLQAMVGAGSYAGISTPIWTSYVDTPGANTILNLADLDLAFMKAAKTGKPSVIIMNVSLFSKYASLLTTKQQFLGTDSELYGGWKALSYMGGNATVVLDYDCPDDCVFILDPSELYYSELKPLDWLPGEKGSLRGIPKTLNYEAIASYMGAIWTLQRNAHSKLTKRIDA